jgi:hypothetical protein
MSALYSDIRKQIKQGNKKLINVSYSPEIYKIFKVIKEDHPGYERKRYTLRKLDNTPLYTESKINEMTQAHTYRRLFASDLLKVDKNTKNIDYDNNRGNQLNQIDKFVKETTPKPIEKPKTSKPIIVDQPQQELRRSTRIRKDNKDNDYIY